jgi:hypothetical protein
MKTRLNLQQETVRQLTIDTGAPACSIIRSQIVSVCDICIPPTESPNCNPTS